MKKLWLSVLSVVFLVLIGCGGGGGVQGAATPPVVCNPAFVANGKVDASTCNITCDSGYILSGTTCVAFPRIKTQGFALIPENEYTEKIVFAVNEGFAQTHVGWEKRVQEIIDLVNIALARNADNKKKYVIGKFMTYPDSRVSVLASAWNKDLNPELYLDNGYANSPGGGTTIFEYLYDDPSKVPSNFLYPSAYAFLLERTVGGKRYNEVWISGLPENGLFANKDIQEIPVDLREGLLYVYYHELGHSLGLANDEWYLYNNITDQSGELPKLEYSRRDMYPLDPMDGVRKSGDLWQFSDINAWIINKNANHQYNGREIIQAIPSEIKVKVMDGQFPVIGATVKVFGAINLGIAKNMKVILETLTTDANGEVIISNDDFTFMQWWAKGIKASFNGKYAGEVLTLTDLQIAYLQQGLNKYILTLRLQ